MRVAVSFASSLMLLWGLLAGTALGAAADQDGDGYTADDCAPLNPTISPGSADVPDLSFRDTNCDGIDGVLATGWFVASGGNDNGAGSATEPFATPQRAVNAASESHRKQVYVAAGTYPRFGMGPAYSGISLYGGYDAASWSRSISLLTHIAGAPEAMLVNQAQDVVVQRLTLTGSADQLGRSAYGLRATNGAEVALIGAVVNAGDGLAGHNGLSGSQLAKPPAADDGNNGMCEAGGQGGTSTVPSGQFNGGVGGKGGEETNDGENGDAGQNGQGPSWLQGAGGGGGIDAPGDASSMDMHGRPGTSGGTGAGGDAGSHGAGDLNAGASWIGRSGTTGGTGSPGGGGGGGGGGAGRGNMFHWSAGGGGGQGGYGGRGGTGGTGGGAGGGSFGIYLHEARVVLDATSVTAGNGGKGGDGGEGGTGGSGGDAGRGGLAPGNCNITAGNGGAGGRGGNGGAGGRGGGGSGGPSAALFRSGTSSAAVRTGSTLTPGTGGARGNGPTLAVGQSGAVLPAGSGGLTDFDDDGIGDLGDACAEIGRGVADADGDGCPDAPETSITSGPAASSFVLSTSAAFGLSSTESGSSFICSLDGGAATACSAAQRYTSLTQRTHILRTWAIDSAVTADPSAATRAWTVPLDSTVLTHSTGWTKKTGTGYYLGTYSSADRKGAALTRNASGIRRVALVATRGPGFGTVRVFLGTSLLKEVQLASSTLQQKQLIPIASFAAARSGTVRVVVTTSAKPVRVEGLGIATAP